MKITFDDGYSVQVMWKHERKIKLFVQDVVHPDLGLVDYRVGRDFKKGGKTICKIVVIIPGDVLVDKSVVGITKCSKKDCFEKRIGRTLSFKKAVEQLSMDELPLADRNFVLAKIQYPNLPTHVIKGL